MTALDMWTPVYDTGCGDRNCPECGPLIEVEIEAKHRKMANRTWPGRSQVSEWLGDCYGTGQERITAELAPKRKAARADRMRAREVVRLKRILTHEQMTQALDLVQRRVSLKNEESRSEHIAEAFLELMNPTLLVSKRESSMNLERRVERAVYRAHRTMRSRKKECRRYVSRNVL